MTGVAALGAVLAALEDGGTFAEPATLRGWRDRLAAAGIVSPTAPRSQIADQFRVIKRPLISNAMVNS